MNTLGSQVKVLREAANLSLRQLATSLRISAPHLSDIELGRRYPSPALLLVIAKVLHADFNELRKLDTRDCLPRLLRLVESDPAWGTVFHRIAGYAQDRKLTPESLLLAITFPASHHQRKPKITTYPP